MISKFEYKGEWKLPKDENWVNGTLTFDPDFGSKLELFGTFNPSIFDRESKEIILGKTTEGDITLVDNWYRGKKHVHNGVTIGAYIPIVIIQGQHFYQLSDIRFSEVTFKVFNLFQWFDLTGINKDFNHHTKGYQIKYDELSNIDFKLKDNLKGVISFDSPLKIGGDYNNIELQEEAYVNLYYRDSENYGEILEDISKIVNLITLLTFEQSYPTFITFKDDKYTEKAHSLTTQKKHINCFYEHSNYDKKHKIRNVGEHLVRYKEVSKIFPRILENWYNLYINSEEVIILVLNYFKNKYKFSPEKFIDITRALESYHRIHYNNERIPKEEFDTLVSTILNQVILNENDLIWLNQRLMGNEPNLKIRMEELIEKNPTKFLESKVEKINKFCRQTTDSRNYYTHYDPKNKKKALSGRELVEVTRVNRAIVISCLLNHIGLESEFYESGLNYNMS